MKSYRYLLLLLFIAAANTGCKKPGCTGNAGSVSLQERLLPVFSKLKLQDNIDLVLIQSDESKIEILGPQNIIANVQTVVQNEELIISNSTDCRWLRNADEKITAKLFFKDISNIEYEGSGNISNTDTLKQEYLWINSEIGAGNVELTVDISNLGVIILKENASMTMHGITRNVSTYTNARGILNLSDLRTENMYMIYSGLADTHIQVSGELEAIIRYRGDVYCKGNPVLKNAEYYSSGRLILQP